MSDELDEDGTPEPRERVVRVRVEQDENLESVKQERDKYKQIVTDLAEQEFAKKKAELARKFPNFAEEINELEPSEMTDFELARFKELVEKSQQIKPRSTGSVSLRKPTEDVVEQVFKQEFDSAQDMMDALVDLSFNPNLTPQQRQRIERAKDTLWHKFNTSKTQPQTMTIAEKLPDAERFYKCRFCGRYVDHNQRAVHSACCKDRFSEVVQ